MSGKQDNVNKAGQISRRLLAGVLAVLIFTGAGNYLLFKLLYEVYGSEYSYFVSQGINFLYLVYGGAVLLPIMMFTDKITPEMRRFPQRKYILMGLLDSLGTFFAAMGSVGTPGHIQILLNQTLIPFCMLLGRVVLKMKFHPLQILGAALIIGGAGLSTIPGLLNPDPSAHTKWYACLIYFASNIPMACSAIYKEYGFRNANLNVWWLTQWVSFYQFIIGFLFIPLLMIPGLSGSNTTVSFVDILEQFWGGVKCTFTGCKSPYMALLLIGYCGVNVVFNTTGLFLTKRGGAVLNSLSFSLLLPINAFIFTIPFLGKYREPFSWYTVGGLFIVLTGFVLYQRYNVFKNPSANKSSSYEEPLLAVGSEGTSSSSYFVPDSFQERIVGAGLAHRRSSFPNISEQRARGWSMGDAMGGVPTTPARRTPYGAVSTPKHHDDDLSRSL